MDNKMYTELMEIMAQAKSYAQLATRFASKENCSPAVSFGASTFCEIQKAIEFLDRVQKEEQPL